MRTSLSARLGSSATYESLRVSSRAFTRSISFTGPVSRGDAGTVAAHLAELADETPDVLPSYVEMARATAMRALASGRLGVTATQDVLDVLSGPKETP